MAFTSDFKKDMYLLYEGVIHYVIDRMYKTQGRQGGLMILKLKNMKTGNLITVTLKAGFKLEEMELFSYYIVNFLTSRKEFKEPSEDEISIRLASTGTKSCWDYLEERVSPLIFTIPNTESLFAEFFQITEWSLRLLILVVFQSVRVQFRSISQTLRRN